MSILDALESFKQERDSIDDIASIPQTLIMQMAQRGQIPKTDLPMILNRKAEMAQAQANINALRAQQAQGGVPPTIMEQLMAANAQQEVPREMTDVGIASNPVPEMRLAGGGIIAFEEGGDVNTEDPFNQLSGLGIEGMANDQARVNAVIERRKLEEQRKKLEEAKSQYQFLKQNAPETATKMLAANPLLDPEAAKPVKPAANPAKPVKPNANPPAPPPAANPPKEDDYMSTLNQMMKDIQAEREALKGNKKDNVNQAMLAAGLKMMAGTSPYAFANIGAGGAAGVEHYGALQAQDARARQGLLKESSELAQAKGIIGQRISDSKQRGEEAKQRFKLESDRAGVVKKRLEMMDKANRFKAVQLWEKEAGPSFTQSLAKQYKGVKNWEKLPEVQKQIADTRTRFINDTLGTMDTGVPSADDL